MKTTKKNEERVYKTSLQLLAENKSNVKMVFDNIRFFYPGGSIYGEDEKMWTDPAYLIFDAVIKFGKGFVVDICQRAKNGMFNLSDKQRWCVAYAIQKLSEEQILNMYADIQ